MGLMCLYGHGCIAKRARQFGQPHQVFLGSGTLETEATNYLACYLGVGILV